MARRRRKAARPALSTERVLKVALRLADAEGLEALSMRRLGRELGVEAMALYRHVKNKDAILDGIVDRVAAELELPDAEDWKEALRRRAHSAHAVLMRHPWAVRLLLSRPNVGPAMLRYVDATVGCLRRAGFSFALADHAWNALDAYVYGFTLQQLCFPFQPDEYASAAETFLPQLPAADFPHLHGLATCVMRGEHDGVQQLGFGLELLLDGLERLLEG